MCMNAGRKEAALKQREVSFLLVFCYRLLHLYVIIDSYFLFSQYLNVCWFNCGIFVVFNVQMRR
jgi:hypothetical protein